MMAILVYHPPPPNALRGSPCVSELASSGSSDAGSEDAEAGGGPSGSCGSDCLLLWLGFGGVTGAGEGGGGSGGGTGGGGGGLKGGGTGPGAIRGRTGWGHAGGIMGPVLSPAVLAFFVGGGVVVSVGGDLLEAP